MHPRKAVWIVRAPALLTAVAEMVAGGADPLAVLRMVTGMVDGARRQAAAVGELVETELWPGTGEPSPELVSAARRVRLLLTQAVGSLFADAAGADLLQRASTPGGAGLDAFIGRIRVGAEPSKAKLKSQRMAGRRKFRVVIMAGRDSSQRRIRQAKSP